MENAKLKNIIEQARNEDFKEKLEISENLQKYYDFDDEIKNLNIEVTSQVLKKIEDSNNNLLIAIFSIFVITSFFGCKFIFSYENILSSFISLFLAALFVLINLIFWFVILLFFFEDMPKIYESEDKYLYNDDVFMVFEKVYYPKEYRDEFKKIFLKHYGKYEKEFSDWVLHSEIDNRKLYGKLLDNKKLQYDILNEIKNKLDNENIKKKIQEEKELLEKNNRRNQIDNFFKNIGKE